MSETKRSAFENFMLLIQNSSATHEEIAASLQIVPERKEAEKALRSLRGQGFYSTVISCAEETTATN